jgi:hypothetical protein
MRSLKTTKGIVPHVPGAVIAVFEVNEIIDVTADVRSRKEVA